MRVAVVKVFLAFLLALLVGGPMVHEWTVHAFQHPSPFR